MRLSILFICFLIQTAGVQGQKNEFSLSFANPLKVDGMDKFFFDDWILEGLYKAQERTYSRFNCGLAYTNELNDKFTIRGKIGVAYRNIYEYSIFQSVSNPNPGQIINVSEENIIQYEQINWNANIGLVFQKDIESYSIYAAPELIFNRFGTGQQKYNFNYVVNDNFYGDYISKDEEFSEISAGYSYGIGMALGSKYNLTNSFSLIVEFSFYGLRTCFTGTTTTNATRNIVDFNGDESTISIENVFNENYKQFSNSNVIASIGISYKL
jgi:hypothetical protein